MSGPDEKPTEAAMKAYRELRSYLRGKGMKSGERKHKSFISTSCPGSILAKMVDKGTLRGGATSPPPPKRPGTRAPAFPLTSSHWFGPESAEIGSASCRERLSDPGR